MCPRELESWCKYQADKQNNTTTYKDKAGLPAAARELIKPIFMDLSNDKLLKKCLHGKTQNNESINNLIWTRCPKDVYVGCAVLERGTASAVINFNQGFQGMLKVFKELGINPGKYCVKFCQQKYSNRIQLMERKATPACKQRRKQLRAKRKGYADADEEREGVTYGPGMF